VNEAGGIKKLLFNYAMARKLYFLRQGCDQAKAAPFFDRLVFKKVGLLSGVDWGWLTGLT
jgi:hypothetical protein